MYAAPTLWNALDLDIRLLPFETFKKKCQDTSLSEVLCKLILIVFILFVLYFCFYNVYRIYCDYCVYHYKSTELVLLYTLDIGLKINIIIIITCIQFFSIEIMIL